MVLDQRSGLSDSARIIIDEFGIGHAKLAIRTKCMVSADNMRNGTVGQAKTLCKKCFAEQIKAHRRFGRLKSFLRFVFPV